MIYFAIYEIFDVKYVVCESFFSIAYHRFLLLFCFFPTDELKKLVGYKAVDDYVKSGMVVGLGTGSTAYFAVERGLIIMIYMHLSVALFLDILHIILFHRM